jgi:Tol biopolymer transport system component
MSRYAFPMAFTWSLVACGGGTDLGVEEQALAVDSRAQALAVDFAAASASTSTAAGSIQLASSTAGGTPCNASSTTCAVSADGNKVLFSSDASNLVAGDSNRTSDLFLKDLVSGALIRVTTQTNDAQITEGGNCLGTTMTPDGRIVAFNSGQAVFAKNTQTGLLTQASPPAGTVPQVTGFFGGIVSDDGTKLVFMTQPETVYVGAYQWVNVIPARLMLRDLGNGSLITLATDNGIVQQGQIVSSRFAISPDGTQLAFESSSASLVPGDTNARPDVFVRDLVNGNTALASSSSDGEASGVVQYWNPTFVSNT